MRFSPLCLPFLIALSCSPSTAVGAEDYEITIVRPVTVGEQYNMVAAGTREWHFVSTAWGRPPQIEDETLDVSMTAKAEIMRATPAGLEAKTRFTIAELTNTVAGKRDEILPAGTEVVGEYVGDKLTFQIGEAEVPSSVAKILELVTDLRKDDTGASSDLVFGTKVRKKIGDSWPVNAAAAAEKYKHLKAAAENIAGTTTLIGVSQGIVNLGSTVTLKQAQFPLPPGMTTTSGVAVARLSGFFPIDATKRATHLGLTMDCQMECAGLLDGKPTTWSTTLKQSRDVIFTAP